MTDTGEKKSAVSFWDWSLDIYGRKGVEPLLLDLQNEFNFNVNLLLWCCWCGAHFELIPEACFRKGHERVADWSASVTGPLRSVHQRLKALAEHADNSATVSLREDVKAAELSAEAIEQNALQGLAAEMLTHAAAADSIEAETRSRRNLALYARLSAAAKKPGFSTALLESLIGHIFLDDSGAKTGTSTSQ